MLPEGAQVHEGLAALEADHLLLAVRCLVPLHGSNLVPKLNLVAERERNWHEINICPVHKRFPVNTYTYLISFSPSLMSLSSGSIERSENSTSLLALTPQPN